MSWPRPCDDYLCGNNSDEFHDYFSGFLNFHFIHFNHFLSCSSDFVFNNDFNDFFCLNDLFCGRSRFRSVLRLRVLG